MLHLIEHSIRIKGFRIWTFFQAFYLYYRNYIIQTNFIILLSSQDERQAQKVLILADKLQTNWNSPTKMTDRISRNLVFLLFCQYFAIIKNQSD
ncbi:unnamed protein product [Paramecium octaurelia]|uniref:Uncharacterized protein n=1 Tax=Paramecium octaurelia TaxID=43137 RepID=A0A8S1Y3P6_PAROT|nr:unnamed protein product [Paramecium octaurelia]